jgi:hypothetical protein
MTALGLQQCVMHFLLRVLFVTVDATQASQPTMGPGVGIRTLLSDANRAAGNHDGRGSGVCDVRDGK